AAGADGKGRRGRARPFLPPEYGRGDGADRRESGRDRRKGRVHGRAVPRSGQYRPQGRDPDPRVLRSSWRHAAAWRPAPHEQAAARSVPRIRGCGIPGWFGSRKRIVPGGASGLQIREGPRAGPWWVRLPFSSATFRDHTMTIAAKSFLDDLKAAAAQAEAAEAQYRQEAVRRIPQLEKEPAFAFRRLNILNTPAGA